jgi:hypothetical protein
LLLPNYKLESLEQTERLLIHPVRELMDELSRKKVKVAMSMNDYPYVRKTDYNIYEVYIRRSLKKGNPIVTELVITNY